jgi:signal transduction histidine kinase
MANRAPVSLFATANVEANTSGPHESAILSKRFLPAFNSALLVSVSYYVGTVIGFAWTPVGQPNSTFWPPNAILLASLLLTPRRTWWAFLLAVLPAHMLAQLHAGVPLWTAAGWFLTNSSEALIGAYCVTRFAPASKRLDSVRGVLIFVVFAVLFAPLATSFLDAAAVVITGWGRGYWNLSFERFWTNALAVLTIVPTLVLFFSKDVSRGHRTGPARWAEATLLGSGTVLVAVVVFGLPGVSPANSPALLYVPLPFLLWAAARFGLPGLGLSLLSLALISTWYTMHRLLPFPQAPLSQNILSLQILFCVVAVPLMFLSVVMAEARRKEESLRRISGNLIEAQEQERQRIARELHDNLGQELALVKVVLDTLVEKSGAPLNSALIDLSKQVFSISETTREISHDLYPAHLEYLGFQKALIKLCEEVGRGKELAVQLRIGDIPDPLHSSTSLSLYRIAQETLHNILRHSQARNVQVDLAADDGQLMLRMVDDGVGFDVSQQRTGQGLVSMRERVLALGGTIDISSSRAAGTKVEVRVPLTETSADSAGADRSQT